MTFGAQFSGTLAPNQSINYFTFGWQGALDGSWIIRPTTGGAGAQVQFTVSTQLSGTTLTYWILVKNLTSATVNIQGRYAIRNLILERGHSPGVDLLGSRLLLLPWIGRRNVPLRRFHNLRGPGRVED